VIPLYLWRLDWGVMYIFYRFLSKN
jgi:hypothetical protein